MYIIFDVCKTLNSILDRLCKMQSILLRLYRILNLFNFDSSSFLVKDKIALSLKCEAELPSTMDSLHKNEIFPA